MTFRRSIKAASATERAITLGKQDTIIYAWGTDGTTQLGYHGSDSRGHVAVDLEGATNTQVWEALGDEFMQGDHGETVELSSLRGEGKVIGLYFSAHW